MPLSDRGTLPIAGLLSNVQVCQARAVSLVPGLMLTWTARARGPARRRSAPARGRSLGGASVGHVWREPSGPRAARSAAGRWFARSVPLLPCPDYRGTFRFEAIVP